VHIVKRLGLTHSDISHLPVGPRSGRWDARLRKCVLGDTLPNLLTRFAKTSRDGRRKNTQDALGKV
jgi:hypothetical protein